MELIHEIREWTFWLMEAGILYYVAREFYYDRDKDIEKQQKKTRTTKKTTKGKDSETIEEITETSEPMVEHHLERGSVSDKREGKDTGRTEGKSG